MSAYGQVAWLGHEVFHFIGGVLANFLGFIASLVPCATTASLALAPASLMASAVFFDGVTGIFIPLKDRTPNRRASELGFDLVTFRTTISVADYRASLNRYLRANGDAP